LMIQNQLFLMQRHFLTVLLTGWLAK